MSTTWSCKVKLRSVSSQSFVMKRFVASLWKHFPSSTLMIAPTCFSHCQLHEHSLALWQALCNYIIMYRELQLCPYIFLLPINSVTFFSPNCVICLVHLFFLWNVIFVPLPFILLSHSCRLTTGSHCSLSPLQCYLTIKTSDFQSICQSKLTNTKGSSLFAIRMQVTRVDLSTGITARTIMPL